MLFEIVWLLHLEFMFDFFLDIFNLKVQIPCKGKIMMKSHILNGLIKKKR